MSGGSYNYLCSKDAADLFDYGTPETLDAMANRLLELGYVDAAKETLHLKMIIEQAKVRALVIKERMEGVWRAVEWYDSADSGIDAVTKAIDKYRGDTCPVCKTRPVNKPFKLCSPCLTSKA